MLRDSVIARHALFRAAVRESRAALDLMKKVLRVTLPADFEWFVSSLGSGTTGAFSGTKDAIKNTLRFRTAVSLPQNYLVLDDRNDAGVVLLDTDSPDARVLWVDMHAAGKLALGTVADSKLDVFPTFEAWLGHCVEETEE